MTEFIADCKVFIVGGTAILLCCFAVGLNLMSLTIIIIVIIIIIII
jgi:hypothetical protein